jgi:hypothetical protein
MVFAVPIRMNETGTAAKPCGRFMHFFVARWPSLRSPRRRWAFAGASLGAVVLAVAALGLVFDAILNGYAKGRIEKAFAAAQPGCALRIGKLEYAVVANRLVARSVKLSSADTVLQVEKVSLTGVRWTRLLWGASAWVDVLAKAGLDATHLDVEFPRAHYGIRCARLQASVPDSELTVEGAELRAMMGDEEFFAAREFRTTRFNVDVPECNVSGLAYGELLQGKSCRARSVRFSSPSFEALVNRDTPVEPFVTRPLMVHEALAAIPRPLRIDSLHVINGNLRYCERVIAGAEPGVLTFSAVNVSVEGIVNRGEASDAILLEGQSDFMNAGVLKVWMRIPVMAPDFSLRYSGSLGAMDLTRLNAFLENAEQIRIRSGSAQETSYEINVTDGRASGCVRSIYKDLKIDFLDKETGSERGLGNRISSFLANALKIRDSNAPDAKGLLREGKVDYTRIQEDEFLQFVWHALRSGILNAIE